MSLLTTILAGAVYCVIRSEFGSKAGIAMALLMIALPLIQESNGMVMADILLALLCFWAVLYCGRFLTTEKWQDAAGFGICATLAILTKGNALSLALVPPLAVVFSRRFHLLIRPSFWCPVLIVLVCCAPWYWLTLDMARNGLYEEAPTLRFTVEAMRFYAWHLVKITGIGLSLLMAIGFMVRVIRPCWERGTEGRWAAVGAWPVSVWVFHSIVPSGVDERYLILAVPALLMFLVAGMATVAEHLPLPRLTAGQKGAVVTLAVALVFAKETFVIPQKAWYGMAEVTQRLLSTPDIQESVILLSLDSRSEGMFIAEIAMRERRPGHIVLRASKILAKSEWTGRNYEALYHTPAEVMSYLEQIPVGVLVSDRSIPVQDQREHHRLLNQMLEAYPQRWELVGTYPLTRGGTQYPDALRMYRLIGHENRRVGTIHIDMSYMLNKTIRR